MCGCKGQLCVCVDVEGSCVCVRGRNQLCMCVQGAVVCVLV